MKHNQFLLLAALFLFPLGRGSFLGGATEPDEIFPKKCLPFADLSTSHPIDTQCSPSGLTSPDSDSDTDPNHLQNRAKNNLCATAPTLRMTISSFDDLQAAAEEKGITFGNQHIAHPQPLPADRSLLKDLAKNEDGASVGGGTKVIFTAFVLKTKPGASESVNCHLTGGEANDIHIVLGRKPLVPGAVLTPDRECDSVTAEMIPHFRPASWAKITLPAILAKLRKHPVRVSGQMFFDASHSPCDHPDFVPGSDPRRRSNWEIHPVYTIDVCKNKTLASCKVDNEAVWRSFDIWLANPN